MSAEPTPWQQGPEEMDARRRRESEAFKAEIEEILSRAENAVRRGRSHRDVIAAEISEIIQRRAAELAAEVCAKLREDGGYD